VLLFIVSVIGGFMAYPICRVYADEAGGVGATAVPDRRRHRQSRYDNILIVAAAATRTAASVFHVRARRAHVRLLPHGDQVPQKLTEFLHRPRARQLTACCALIM